MEGVSLLAAADVLASLVVRSEETGPDLSTVIDGAGPIAGLFILLLAVALFFLMRSMNRQLKKVDPSLPNAPQPTAPEAVVEDDESPPAAP